MKTTYMISAGIVAMLAIGAIGGCDHQVNEIAIPAGITKLETVQKKGDELVLPYTKYKLDNGLTVLLHKDTSDPLVHVDITYHVGSGREEPGKSGFAHFFEHMMFQGSENVADEQHFGLITESGGTLNGSTNTDRTNYYETVPSNQLERMLWLESDRMGFFLDAVTTEKFENQRETVKNERGQNYDNRPYGLLRERVNEALYPEGHPYSWLTIGYIEDLNRADLKDLKKFFLRWYGPNNATLTIGGDIDEQQTLEWVKQYFGGIPAGPEVTDSIPPSVSLDKDRYISMEDNVSLPLIYMSWPTVYLHHEDEAPLDVLMSILGDGKTSLLYKNTVKIGKAAQASAGHGCAELACTFTLLALPTPDSDLSELEGILRASLAEFEERGGATKDDIEKVKSGILSGMIYGLESVSGKVRQLAQYQTIGGDANFISKDIARYENVTTPDVMRVYKHYIKDKPAVIMSIVPNGERDAIARPDTWNRYERAIPKNTDTSDLQLRPGTSDFDRSVIPTPGPNPVIKTPQVYNADLGGNIKITGAINDDVPTTALRIRIPAGATRESLETLGVASLTASMLDEATMDNTAEDLSLALQKMGSNVSFSSGSQYTTIYVKTLSKNLDATLAIAIEKLTKPKFAQVDFDRLKKNVIEDIKSAKKDPAFTASSVYSMLLFGKNNSFAMPRSGTLETVENLTLEDVKAFYANHYGSKNTDILVVSDLAKTKIKSALKNLETWEGSFSEPSKIKPFPELAAGTLYFIDKPGAAQSQIRIGKRGLKYDAIGEYYRLDLMNYNLGGAFNSRINLNLREEKGYTYGARSGFYGNDIRGVFSAQAGVRSDTTVDSIRQFIKEMDNYQKDGMTDQEMDFLKGALGQRDARSFETPNQKLGFLSTIVTYGLAPDYKDEQNRILQSISKPELNALAAKYLKTNEMVAVVVGDKETVLPKIQAELDYTIIELDADGNPVK